MQTGRHFDKLNAMNEGMDSHGDKLTDRKTVSLTYSLDDRQIDRQIDRQPSKYDSLTEMFVGRHAVRSGHTSMVWLTV